MRDAPIWQWALIGVGGILWIVLVFVAFDPLLRKLIQSASGIELVRHRDTGTSLAWSSVTPGRGTWLAILWQPFLYFLCVLPVIVGVGIAMLRWYAAHKK